MSLGTSVSDAEKIGAYRYTGKCGGAETLQNEMYTVRCSTRVGSGTPPYCIWIPQATFFGKGFDLFHSYMVALLEKITAQAFLKTILPP